MSIETMTKLATYTVGAGGISTFSFTNIPQTYTDLKIFISARSLRASDEDGFGVLLNNNGANNWITLSGNGSSGSSGTSSSLGYGSSWVGRIPGNNATSNTFGNLEIYIPNYTLSNYKTISIDAVTENNGNTAYQSLTSVIHSTTSPITSLGFLAGNANLAQNTTVTLYGIKNMRTAAGNSIKATGGAISFDGTYVVHTFNESGTFTPTSNIPYADYLVVAGGGGGGLGNNTGSYSGGGGGAGGLRSTVTNTGGGGSLESAISFAANNNYTVTVGAGGTGATTDSSRGTNGSDSLLSFYGNIITSTGGGAGGSINVTSQKNGASGGSGGGSTTEATGGAGTANQGYAGGSNASLNNAGSGGGGAGAVGTSGTSGGLSGQNGGIGVAVAITGSLIYYAGGGGGGGFDSGGTGGNGGGGNGGRYNVVAGTKGSPNTGGGGGGWYVQAGSAYAGGSGIVIIRYKA